MCHIHVVVQESHVPEITRIFRRIVCITPHTGSFPDGISTSMQRYNNQRIPAFRHTHPSHPLHRWLMWKGYNLPAFSRVFGTDEIMNRAGLFRVACFIWIPLCANSNFYLFVSGDITRSNGYIVELCKIFRDDEPLPVAIAIPDDLLFVGEQNIRSAVAVHITDGQTVPDGYLVINHLSFKLRDWQAIGICRSL